MTRDRMDIGDRLLAEADARAAANRQAWADYVAARNDERLARGHVRPQPMGAVAAYVLIIAGAIIGALAVWLVPATLFAAFDWIAGWM